MDTNLILIGAISFALHFIGKWQSTTCAFLPWITTKENTTYFISSLLLCALALILQPELSEAFGMLPRTYATIACYGGGHLVARYLEVKQAVEIKQAAQ